MLRHLPSSLCKLTGCPALADASRRQLEVVERFGTFVDFAPRRQICRPEAAARQLVLVLSGTVFARGKSGRHRWLRAGECFGAVHDDAGSASLLESFEAVSHVFTFIIDRREFTSLRASFPEVAARLARMCSATDSAMQSIGLDAAVPHLNVTDPVWRAARVSPGVVSPVDGAAVWEA